MRLKKTKRWGVSRLWRPVMGVEVCVLLAASAGCDEALFGRYDEVNGWGRLEFHGQTVHVTVAIVGSTFAAEYEVRGHEVIVNESVGHQVLHIQQDGSLRDGMGLRFVRQ
jgi:hypothetical protein